MNALPPWANGPFELLLHAEMHLRIGEDFDRRMAMISLDNAIELSITTYLNLHPIQRGGREYPTASVSKWLNNYHTRLEFFEVEISSQGVPILCKRADVVWYHNIRNQQYHQGALGVPSERDLDGIRKAAFWVFGVLFEVSDVQGFLENEIKAFTGETATKPPRDKEKDLLLDDAFGVIEVAQRKYRTSDVLYAVDPFAYATAAGSAEITLDEETPKKDPE